VPNKTEKQPVVDIHQLLLEASKRRERETRAQLLQLMGVKEFFEGGSIQIDMKTCKGVECNLCIEACPTKALYWKAGEIGIQRELCVYCAACVWSCIVDDCIRVERRRPNGKTERFSSPREVFRLLDSINSQKRVERMESRFPDLEAFLSRYGGAVSPFFEKNSELTSANTKQTSFETPKKRQKQGR